MDTKFSGALAALRYPSRPEMRGELYCVSPALINSLLASIDVALVTPGKKKQEMD